MQEQEQKLRALKETIPSSPLHPTLTQPFPGVYQRQSMKLRQGPPPCASVAQAMVKQSADVCKTEGRPGIQKPGGESRDSGQNQVCSAGRKSGESSNGPQLAYCVHWRQAASGRMNCHKAATRGSQRPAQPCPMEGKKIL
jgi:hypothetical protein